MNNNWLSEKEAQLLAESVIPDYFEALKCPNLPDLVQNEIERGLKCSICQKIPFDLFKCNNCPIVYCKKCAEEIQCNPNKVERLCEC